MFVTIDGAVLKLMWGDRILIGTVYTHTVSGQKYLRSFDFRHFVENIEKYFTNGRYALAEAYTASEKLPVFDYLLDNACGENRYAD